jgi:hypothetical protein
MELDVEKELRQFRELPNISIFPNDLFLDIFDWLPIGSVVGTTSWPLLVAFYTLTRNIQTSRSDINPNIVR